ncbi:MAG: methylated-DNA--[protein]-cysteine S-methyltransferase [Acidimicrobiia bacterium]
MTDITTALERLGTVPPDDLGTDTVYTAGAADRVTRTQSPVGDLWVSWSVRGITGVSPVFESADAEAFATLHRRHVFEASHLPRDLNDAVVSGLADGDTIGLPVDYRGLTTFQVSVLESCATIPAGVVRPYNWIAAEIDNPGAIRAVGTALGKNPIPFLVPCHRVVRNDGSVGNYAFGPEMKQQLLVREGAILA